jgi:NADH-quinone oxidoreductase subunit D
MEILTGNRNNYGMFKIGGVRRDIQAHDIPLVLQKINSIVPTLEKLAKAINDDPVLRARTEGIGILPKDAAIDYCAVGPTARASGVARDVRKDSPYGAYPQIDWDMIVTHNGDVFDKVQVRVKELFESIKIITSCFSRLPAGEIECVVKNIPPGEGIGHIEAPRGECFHYVRSDGTNRPVRHKIRAPTFMNLPTYKTTVVGQTIADAAIILAAIDPCYCCTERMVVRNCKGDTLFAGEELLRLSREKTEQLRTRMGR